MKRSVEITRRYYRTTTITVDIPEDEKDPIDYVENLDEYDQILHDMETGCSLEFEDVEIEMLPEEDDNFTSCSRCGTMIPKGTPCPVCRF